MNRPAGLIRPRKSSLPDASLRRPLNCTGATSSRTAGLERNLTRPSGSLLLMTKPPERTLSRVPQPSGKPAGPAGDAVLHRSRSPKTRSPVIRPARSSPAGSEAVVSRVATPTTSPAPVALPCGSSRTLSRKASAAPSRPAAQSCRQSKADLARARLREVKVDLAAGDASRLEAEAVAPATAKDYQARLLTFDTFCGPNRLKVGASNAGLMLLELMLLEFFDHLFLSGAPLDAGTKLLAAVGHRWPALHHSARTGQLARARRALQGWNRLAPLPTRLPAPWPAVSAIAMALIRMGWSWLALAVVVAADCYLRPGELLSLTSDSVCRAQPAVGRTFRHTSLLLFPQEKGVSSKTHEFDDSVVVNTPGREWLGPLLEARAALVGPGMPLFPVTPSSFTTLFKTAASQAGLAPWNLSLYVLRHSGPSHDILAGLRTLLEVKRRGRWLSDQSVRRYEKSSRVTSRLQTLDGQTLTHLQKCDEQLEAALKGVGQPTPRL